VKLTQCHLHAPKDTHIHPYTHTHTHTHINIYIPPTHIDTENITKLEAKLKR